MNAAVATISTQRTIQWWIGIMPLLLPFSSGYLEMIVDVDYDLCLQDTPSWLLRLHDYDLRVIRGLFTGCSLEYTPPRPRRGSRAFLGLFSCAGGNRRVQAGSGVILTCIWVPGRLLRRDVTSRAQRGVRRTSGSWCRCLAPGSCSFYTGIFQAPGRCLPPGACLFSSPDVALRRRAPGSTRQVTPG